METLFKFALVRSPVEQSHEAPSIALAQDTPFQSALEQLRDDPTAREARKKLARDYVGSANFVTDTRELQLGPGVEALRARLDELAGKDAVSPDDLRDAFVAALGTEPSAVVVSDAYSADVQRLRDSIIAVKLLPEEHKRPMHRLVGALQDLELLRRLAEAADFPSSAEAFRRYRRRSLELSIGSKKEGVVNRSVLAAARRERRRRDDDDRRAKVEKQLARLRAVVDAGSELARAPTDALAQTALRASAEALPPQDLRPLALFKGRVDKASSSRDRGSDTTPVVAAGAGGTRGALAGRSPVRAEDLAATGFKLADRGAANLSAGTKSVLKELAIEPTAQALDQIVDRLRGEVKTTLASLDRLAGPVVQRTLKRIGGGLVVIKTPIASPWADTVIGSLPGLGFPPPPSTMEAQVPTSHGNVAPAGVTDLIVVKQQLVRYEATEVAHIENVLQGEKKQRDHRRRQETEQVTLREREVTKSEERELETADRFEMVRETSDVLRESAALSAGLTISGSYGPTVEFSAYAEGAVSRDREQATATASTFSKETTQRSASRITERVLHRESLRITTEVEEQNTHVLDNVGGQGHIRGVYQWVEKVYEAQMYNYGLRLVYDFMVPEPAAFLIAALEREHATATEVEKPMRFALRPNQITEYNYQAWVHEYGATDVEPPPEPFLTKSLDYSAGGGDESTDYNHSAQVTIDEGYRAIHASVGVTGNVWDANASVDVVIGQRANRIENAGYKVWHTSLDNERGSIPFALNTFRQSDVAVAVEVKVQRTEHAMDRWRHATHAKLTLAYRARLAEYEEQLASLKAEAGIAIRGNNPALNLELMNTEVRKACVSILTDQHFDLFDAVENGTNGLPQPDLSENEAEGPYVRFFEQAFEWQQMTWLTYPYFWGRKSEWADRIAFEDTDPLFTHFLKAGYCRVVVPVRPGFEGAVDHFMTFGEPWVGGPLPPISSPLYLPIADELAERLDRPGDEIPQGEPWEVRIPTALVRLRDDGSLPSWAKDEDGNWHPQ